MDANPQLTSASTLQAIQYLASHVPLTVLRYLASETEQMQLYDYDEDSYDNERSFHLDMTRLREVFVPCNATSRLKEVFVPYNATARQQLRKLADGVIAENDDSLSEIHDAHDSLESADATPPPAIDICIENQDTVGDPYLSPRQQRTTRPSFSSDKNPGTDTGCHSLNPRRQSAHPSWVSIRSHKYFPGSTSLPYASRHDASLLLVDISGFTRLSTMLTPEALSTVINEYFQLLVNEVTQLGGDILQFAGDALFATWRASANTSTSYDPSLGITTKMDANICVAVAAVCGAKIVSKYSQYVPKDAPDACLSVHCAISFGTLASVHVGDYNTRRQYLVLGSTIDGVAKAASVAQIGEIAACPASMEMLSKTCDVDDSIDISHQLEPVIIARHTTQFFSLKTEYRALEAGLPYETSLVSRLDELLGSFDLLGMMRYQNLLSLYVHPIVAKNAMLHGDTSIANIRGMETDLQTRHLEEAELRNVCVLFISPLLNVSITGDDQKDSRLFMLLNAIMNFATTELSRFGGHMRQFIVDDKGLVLIATFGLRGSTFQGMVSERVLPTAAIIQNGLTYDYDVQSRIGVTMGSAYCGVVGGILRHEYAVLGPSVNLAARLMASSSNPGILVDDAIRRTADKTYRFRALSPVNAKGYIHPVAIFEPIPAFQRNWVRMTKNFVGRSLELESLATTALRITRFPGKSPATMFLVSGDSGMGKSTFTLRAIEQTTRTLRWRKKRVFVTKCTIKNVDGMTPFGAIVSILTDIIGEMEGNSMDDASVESVGGSVLSVGTSVGYSTARPSQIADHLSSIFNEIGVTKEFTELVSKHLLNLNVDWNPDVIVHSKNQGAGSPKKSLSTLMVDVILSCARNADLTIVAFDDVQFADEMSLKVIRQLLDRGFNMLIICTTCCSLSSSKLGTDDSFWESLKVAYFSNGRFMTLKLSPLNESEMRTMIANNLALEEKDVSEQLLSSIMFQSKGNPQFAVVVLDHMKRDSTQTIGDLIHDVTQLPTITDASSTTLLEQLILQKIDIFDGTTRTVLNLAAVMGSSFALSELISVMLSLESEVEDDSADRVAMITRISQQALALAETEGIVYIEYSGGESSDDDKKFLTTLSRTHLKSTGSIRVQDLTYCFSEEIWRSLILQLMLDRREADIHRAIASTLEIASDVDKIDLASRLSIFNHWKASNDFVATSRIALSTGKIFENLGLHKQSTLLCQDTISMLMKRDDSESNVSGFSTNVLSSISCDQVIACIMLYIALGKAFTTLHEPADAVDAYQKALAILKESKHGNEIDDRSIAFPVFSGLFVLLKMGAIKDDATCSYERGLVTRFVDESRLNGDPVHFARALAMEADMNARQGDFEGALSTHDILREVYEPSIHSAGICSNYGSDRAAQCITLSALWLVEVGRPEDALRTCEFVISEIMPIMEPSNIHNSSITLYPIIWILKDNRMVSRAKQLFLKYVVDAFNFYFGEQGSTFSLQLFSPMVMLMDLDECQDTEMLNLEKYTVWALCKENLRFVNVLSMAMLMYGRYPDTISAEICLLLAKRPDVDVNDKSELIANGRQLCEESVEVCKRMNAGPSLRRALPILYELEKVALDNGFSWE